MPGDLHTTKLDAGSFVSITPDVGITMVTEPDGTVAAISSWDPIAGDVSYNAPIGSAGGGGTRRHLFQQGVYVVVAGTPRDVLAWSSLTGVPATFPPSAHTHTFASLKLNDGAWPTTIAGYGITGAQVFDGAVTIPGALTLNGIAYTFPAAQAAGRVLQTNGAGVLSWVATTATLAALTDVTITTPADGQLLRYDSASAKWINTSTMKVASGVVTIGTDPGGTEPLRVGGGIRASGLATFQLGISVSGAASSMNRASSGQTILNMSVVGDPFGRLNMFSDGSFSMGTGAASPDATFGRIGAGNVRLTGGSDGSSTWTIGQGGAAPTAGRSAKLVLNSPSSGTFVGQTFIQYQLDGVTKWQTGTTTDAVSGSRLATTDYAWYNGAAYVAGLSTTGLLTLAGGLIAGTDPGGSQLVRVGGDLMFSGRLYGKRAAGNVLSMLSWWDEISSLTDVLLGTAGNAIAFGNEGGAPVYFVTNGLARAKIDAVGAFVLGTDPGGTQLMRVGGAVSISGTTLISVSAGVAVTVSTAVASTPMLQLKSTSTSNGPLVNLENVSGTAAFRSFAIAANYGVSGALEFRISNASNGDPLVSGATALMLTPGRGVRAGDGQVMVAAATDGFLHFPAIGGAPTGTPNLFGGSSMASAYAYAAKRLWIYNSAAAVWDYVQFT